MKHCRIEFCSMNHEANVGKNIKKGLENIVTSLLLAADAVIELQR